MTHRTDRIPLAASEARCEPERTCHQRDTCARYMAALPPSGAQMIGADMPSVWVSGCWQYVSVASVRAGKVAPAPRPLKPAIKGIA